MQRISKFYDTRHVNERIRERQLPLDDMKQIVNYHDMKIQQYRGNHGGFVYKFKKTVEGKTLAVIAETRKDECWLISGFYEAH